MSDDLALFPEDKSTKVSEKLAAVLDLACREDGSLVPGVL